MIATCTRQIDLEEARKEASAIISNLEARPVSKDDICKFDKDVEIQFWKNVKNDEDQIERKIMFGFVVDYVPGYSMYAVLPRESKTLVMVDSANVIKAC